MSAKISHPYVNYHNDNTSRKLDHEQFRVQLAIQLLEEAGTQPLQPQQHPTPLARLTERHFLEKVPSRVSGQQAQPECRLQQIEGKGEEDDTISVQTVQAGNVRGTLLRAIPHRERPTALPLTPLLYLDHTLLCSIYCHHYVLFIGGFSKSHQSTKTFTKWDKCYMNSDLT